MNNLETTYEIMDAQVHLNIHDLNSKLNMETDTKYFDIDYDGVISLKPEYRGDASPDQLNSAGEPIFPFSVSDRGLGYPGSKINELPERIIFPAFINEIAVTGFQKGMFYHNQRIKKIVFPNCVTEIPNAFCYEAKNLYSIENTEGIMSLGTSAFSTTRIEKAIFPNLQQLRASVFSICPMLIVVDIGNTITEIPKQCFMVCNKLSNVFGGACIRSVGDYAFYHTWRLKNLSFLPQLTSIGDYGFFRSRVNFDWTSLENCTFGTYATYAQINTTDYWSNVSFTPCENTLLSLFDQRDPQWVNEPVGNNTYTYEEGCVTVTMATIYSAFEGIELSSPKDFEVVLEEINPSLLSLDMRYHSNAVTILEALGYSVTRYTTIGQTELQNIYNALSEGALLCKTIMISTNPDGGHMAVGYGVNEIGELMIADSVSYHKLVDCYGNFKYSMPIQALGNANCEIIVVQKTSSTN